MIETTLIISIIAIVLSASAPTFVRALRLSKITEATEQLARLQAAVQAYYAQEHESDAGAKHGCVPEPAGPTPAQPSQQPVLVDFGAEDVAGRDTWQALGFQSDEALRYRYSLVTDGAGCRGSERAATAEILLRAEGDLDGDAALSLFERRLQLSSGELIADELLFVRDRAE